METIKASDFKAKCLQLMDRVSETGEPIVITKHGLPVARLEPVKKPPKSLFGALKGQIEVTGDIMSPLDEDWNAVNGDWEPK